MDVNASIFRKLNEARFMMMTPLVKISSMTGKVEQTWTKLGKAFCLLPRSTENNLVGEILGRLYGKMRLRWEALEQKSRNRCGRADFVRCCEAGSSGFRTPKSMLPLLRLIYSKCCIEHGCLFTPGHAHRHGISIEPWKLI